MRKLWYAGAAVASGLILFAASPARADDQPSTPPLLPGNSVAPPLGDLLSRSARDVPPDSVIGPLQPGSGGGGGLPLLGGLLPNGGQQQSFADPSAVDPSSLDRPTVGETESLPLLGGLLPVPGTPTVPDVSGLPGGGMAVLAPAVGTPSTATGRPSAATGTHVKAPAAPAVAASSAAPDDPRLHEEPIDASERTFSPEGRPVAGVDQQFK